MLMSDLSSDVDTAYDFASRLSCKSTVGKLSYTRTTDAIYHKLDIAIISWIFAQCVSSGRRKGESSAVSG